MATPAYPPLSTLLPTSGLGAGSGFGGLSFLNSAGQAVSDMVADVLEPLRYRDLSVEFSEAHDIGLYRFTMITEQAVAFDLLAGLRLVLFPDAAPGAATASSIGVTFAYEWPIRAYVKRFRAGGDPGRAAFDLFLQLAGITDKELYARLLAILAPSQNDYAWLIGKLSSWNQDFQDPGVAAGTEIDQILEGLEAVDADPYQAAFEAIVLDATGFDLDLVFDCLRNLFEELIGSIDRHDVEALLLPQLSVTLGSLGAAIEFPANVLTPTDGSPVSKLAFTFGALTYDTRTGFDVAVDEGLAVSLTPSTIGKTGVTLQIDTCKLDLSPRYNIPEAIADMRPPDFMGVYFKSVIVGLPAKWFSQPTGNTLGIVGRNLLIGTGGLSGTIGLEALATGGSPAATKTPPPAPTGTAPPPELQFVLGKAPQGGGDRKGFILGFSTFTMNFRQNQLLSSRIKGSLTLPGFKDEQGDPGRIAIELMLDGDGDFEISAGLNPGLKLKVPGIFSFNLEKMKVGKEDRGVYAACSGDLSFAENALLGQLISQPIHLEELRIGSDGSVSLKGGEVPLPKSATLNIGPVKITVSAIQFGSFTREHQGVERPYRFIGFSGAVSTDPGMVGGRGDGVRFCYSIDDLPRHMFMEVDGIGISILIPGGASAGDAVLRVEGYLKLKKPVYQGSIKFALPKVGFVGGAAMKYDTRFPAWIIRVDLQLPTVIPLGSLPVGIYSFSGLFGWLYTASKQALQPPLPAEASWGDYYRAPERGIPLEKFSTPEDNRKSGKPFSIGVGVGLCTSNDDGHILSAQVFLLVSLSNLILLEGGFVLLEEEKLAPTDTPPFYAYMALAPGESFEFGSGIDYLVPKDSGKVLKIDVVLKAYFSFRNSRAWYMQLGTKAHPCTADILGLFRGYAYLGLSATGIETGAGVSFDFVKRYGPIGVEAHAYLDFWAYVSFLNGHAGGGIGMGGMVEATLFGFGFHIGLAAVLNVDAPRPFYVAGSVEVCVSVKILKKRITKCCDVSFVWKTNDLIDKSPAPILTVGTAPAASAVHMVSGATYDIIFSTSPSPPPPPTQPGDPPLPPPIPLDCFLDIKFTRPVDPSAVASKIGGYSSPAEGAGETVPPAYGTQRVEHRYALEQVDLEMLDNGNWVAYDPYAALAPEALLDPTAAAQLAAAPIARWQKKGIGYSDLRFLALTPFSWMAPEVGHRPEELGVTPHSTYCVGRAREPRCLTWTEPKAYPAGLDQFREGVLYRVDGDRMEAAACVHPRLKSVSLAIGPSGQASFQFDQPVAQCSIDLVTTAPWVKLRWQRRKPPAIVGGVIVGSLWGPPEFEDVGPPQVVQRAALTGAVTYSQPSAPIDRILIETPPPDLTRITELEEAIAQAELDSLFEPGRREELARRIAELRRALRAEHDKTCLEIDAYDRPAGGSAVGSSPSALAALLDQHREQAAALAELRESYQRFCVRSAAVPSPGNQSAMMTAQQAATGPGQAPQSAQVIGAVPDPHQPSPGGGPGMSAARCRALAETIEAYEAQLRELEVRIAEFGREQGGGRKPWNCGTFIHELCWLSLKDFEYNQNRPGLDAIAADYSLMRDAIEGQLQPIWAPDRQFRIRLRVADTVSGTRHGSDYYVHFRTGQSIGLYKPRPDPLDDPPAGPASNDRQEVPERSLRFYVDLEKSRPNPTGKLTYEKPVYTRDVKIRLFFSRPYAYHFFADWPGNGQKYRLELAVKDPAETPPDPDPQAPAHLAPIVAAPYLGSQSWPVEPDPRVPLEVRTLAAFRDRVAEPGSDGTGLVCLSEGGEPITPLARSLLVELEEELDPNKLYTAVVLNRRTDVAEVAEVMSYPFKTSYFSDPVSHFHSYRLTGANGAARLAVFDIDHVLPGNAAQTIAAARAIVAGGPPADPAAWPDPYDGLVHGLLELPPRPAAPTIEFNFVTDPGAGTFGLLVDGPEPLYDPRLASAALTGPLTPLPGPDYDPRLPASALQTALTLLVNDAPVAADLLFSRDRSKAFITVAGGGQFPTQNVAIGFAVLDWQGNVTGSVVSDAFSRT
jgi:hypothetical protein